MHSNATQLHSTAGGEMQELFAFACICTTSFANILDVCIQEVGFGEFQE